MRRRSVVIAGLAALLLAPETVDRSAYAIERVGIPSQGDSERAPMFNAFSEGLHNLGYIERRSITLEFRLARGNCSLFPRLAAELATLPVSLIVSDGGARSRES